MATLVRPRRNHRTASTASAFMGVIGVPDPGRGPQLGDGGLREFCRVFNRRYDEKAETDWVGRFPEARSFARTERYFAAVLR